jgi:hypothetical protein
MTETQIELPSGSTISAETWGWIREAGDWRGFLDARMYVQADRDYMDKELARG